MTKDRFVHNPLQFVGVATPTLVYVGIADRADFDRIAAPCVDHGAKEGGHVLTKTVGNLGTDEVSVVFQYWILSLTADAILTDARRDEAGNA